MEKESLRFQFDEQILRTQLEIQEQTLKNISQEIHDNIGQMLSLAKLNLALAESETETNPNPRISNSHELVSKAIQDLRDLSRSLNTEYISDMGLQRAIEYELELIRKTGIMEVELIAEGHPRRFDKQKELILFRIVQESLNNIIKHADAKKLTIKANYTTPVFALQISDDGHGVDLAMMNDNKSPSFGLGIRNMHNRAKLIGADFKISSTLGEGTIVSIQLPKE